MSIFHILLVIYLSLTFIAGLVGYAACIVAGRSETLRVRQPKKLSRLLPKGDPQSGVLGLKVGITHWLTNIKFHGMR